MIKNYLKIAWRTLMKTKGYSMINIGGLAIGMTCFLLIMHYVQFERSYENFHKNADNIARITLDLYKGSEYVVTDCEMYAPAGPMLKDKMPEVIDFVRMMNNDNPKVKIGAQIFLENRSYFADPSVFTIFSYKILHGDAATALSAPYQVVLTASTARKYFGREDAVGESLEIGSGLYKVTAILEDVPANTHLRFNFLISHLTLQSRNQNYTDHAWNTGNNEYTYLLMKPGVDLAAFNVKLKAFSESMKENFGTDRIAAEPIHDIHLYSNKTFEPDVNGSARTVYFLFMIAIFVLVLAWVNYVNLSTARAIERAREVGIRKVMGSFRSQLVFQFLSESLIVNLIATIFSIALLKISLPYFRDVSGATLSMNIFQEATFWYMLVVLLLVGVVLSGLYPATALSSFNPVTVLKGKYRSSAGGQWLRKGLVVFQFAATAMLIGCFYTVYLQIGHLRNADLGMNIEQTLVLRSSDLEVPDSLYASKYQALKNELLKNPAIEMVARSHSMPGLDLNELSTTNNILRYGQDQKGGSYNYYHYPVDADFVPTFGITLAAGRNFQRDMKNFDEVLINEEAAHTLGFASPEEAVGEKITYRTRRDTDHSIVIGVIKNFRQRSPKEKQLPMIFRYSEFASYFSMKIKTDQVHETVDFVKEQWTKVFPADPFSYFFLDEKYNQQYKADAQFGQVVAIFSVLAIVIACLGLFGLSSFTILQRTKEIGIRKVLGGSAAEIVRLVSKDFVQLVVVAGVIAIPFSYFAMRGWLLNYAERIDLNIWIFFLPLIAILVVSLATISLQTIKAARANPVDAIKES